VFLSTLLLYFLIAEPGPQYLIWVLPLLAVDVALADRLRVLLASGLLGFAFLQWFLVSSAFLTPSGFSLLMFPLAGTNLPGYVIAIENFLDSGLVGIIILPLASSATFAFILAYAVEQIRAWFYLPKAR
jgi:hypothetical protein